MSLWLEVFAMASETETKFAEELMKQYCNQSYNLISKSDYCKLLDDVKCASSKTKRSQRDYHLLRK